MKSQAFIVRSGWLLSQNDPQEKNVSSLLTFCPWRRSPISCTVLPVLFCPPMQYLHVHVCFEAHFVCVPNTAIRQFLILAKISVLHDRCVLETCSLCAFALALCSVWMGPCSCLLLLFLCALDSCLRKFAYKRRKVLII